MCTLVLLRSMSSRAMGKALAQKHVQDLEQKITQLAKIKSELKKLVDCCHGDDRPECPIIDGLSDHVA